jgi:16S rRNA (adenine(1408)-N(1))-methyltransferase
VSGTSPDHVDVVRGPAIVATTAPEIAERLERASRVVADVGAGDARLAYRLAKADPDLVVVGIDPAWDRMVPTSTRSLRKPARGGVANLLLVRSTIEDLPSPLDAVADEVLVLMPWGKLLRGVVLGDDDVLAGLRRLAKPGATLDVTIGTSIWRDPVPLAIRDLPELTPAVALDQLAPKLRAAGWELGSAEVVDAGGLPGGASSWARRLDATKPEEILHLAARAT